MLWCAHINSHFRAFCSNHPNARDTVKPGIRGLTIGHSYGIITKYQFHGNDEIICSIINGHHGNKNIVDKGD
jgi:hypothetical protein